jgi:hypothetical protein
MKKISFLILLALVFNLVLPKTVFAETTTVYAESVYSAGNQTYQPTKALGEPDGSRTSFFEKNSAITLDLGEGNESTSNLTMYYLLQNFGAGYRVEFLDNDFTVTQTESSIFPLSLSELTFTYARETSYRYVRVTSIREETWVLDAIMTTVETVEEVPIATETVEETIEEIIIPISEKTCSASQGLLIKRVDDNNPTTVADSVVYVVGCDDSIHVFPNETVYKSWWSNFDDVAFVDGTYFAQHELEADVTIRPGTYLVKQTSDPKVYAVESNGVLRWIPNETVATTLYGTNWNKIIIDLPDEIFSHYTIGDDLTTEAYPDGVVGYLPEGRVVYLSENYYYNLPGSIMSSLRFRSEFLVPLSAEVMTNYIDGGEDLEYSTSIAFPF